MLVSPSFVFISGDEICGAHFQRILLLGGSARDCNNAIAAQKFGIDDPKVTYAPDADNADFLARTGTVPLQRRKRCESYELDLAITTTLSQSLNSPPHIMGAAVSEVRPSGILKTKPPSPRQ